MREATAAEDAATGTDRTTDEVANATVSCAVPGETPVTAKVDGETEATAGREEAADVGAATAATEPSVSVTARLTSAPVW